MTKPLAIAAAAAILWFSPANAEGPTDILNVSYDVSRELYADINKAFNAKYKADTGTDITINQSHAEAFKADQEKAQDFVRKLFANVPVFDTGGRAATTTFVERDIGDVLVTFEAEVQSIGRQYGQNKVDLILPSVSLRADFPVSVVDKVVDQRGSRKLAETYLQYLYTPEAQEIIAAHFNRPIHKAVAAKHASDFGEVRLVTVEDVFGGWKKVTEEHLADGGILDRLYVGQ